MDKRTILINRKDEFKFEKKYNYSVISFFSEIYPRNNSVKVIREIEPSVDSKNYVSKSY